MKTIVVIALLMAGWIGIVLSVGSDSRVEADRVKYAGLSRDSMDASVYWECLPSDRAQRAAVQASEEAEFNLLLAWVEDARTGRPFRNPNESAHEFVVPK